MPQVVMPVWKCCAGAEELSQEIFACAQSGAKGGPVGKGGGGKGPPPGQALAAKGFGKMGKDLKGFGKMGKEGKGFSKMGEKMAEEALALKGGFAEVMASKGFKGGGKDLEAAPG